MVKKTKARKRGLKKARKGVSYKKKDIGKGYTQDIQKKVNQIRELEKKEAQAEKEYKEKKERYSEEKKGLIKSMKELRDKKILERKNLTRLTNYVRKKIKW